MMLRLRGIVRGSNARGMYSIIGASNQSASGVSLTTGTAWFGCSLALLA